MATITSIVSLGASSIITVLNTVSTDFAAGTPFPITIPFSTLSDVTNTIITSTAQSSPGVLSSSVLSTYTGPSTSTSASLVSASSISRAVDSIVSGSSTSSSSSTNETTSPSARSSTATSPVPTRHHKVKSDDRLSNGTVAGIVIASALGLALITFLGTVLFMRRRGNSGRHEHSRRFKNSDPLRSRKSSPQDSPSEPKGPFVTEISNSSDESGSYLPQSADDATVQTNVKTLLDQVELHVENFYQNSPSGRVSSEDVSMFDSPGLPNPPITLLAQGTDAISVIKHALAESTVSAMSWKHSRLNSLLPDEYVSLPTASGLTKNSGLSKAGLDECMSRWRVLTAYIRPTPSQDSSYIAQRDHRIQETVQEFSRAFAPWKNLKYHDGDRTRSLSAILKSAADVGIWMFSQPSSLQFRWPTYSEVGANRIAAIPALIKLTDEKGRKLREPHVMLQAVIKRV